MKRYVIKKIDSDFFYTENQNCFMNYLIYTKYDTFEDAEKIALNMDGVTIVPVYNKKIN